ncbi:hypothetical protein ACWEQC_44380 [Streptomyces shenzhenensis]
MIAASPELQERELVKRSGLADTIAAALRDRGTAEPAAAVVGRTAVTVYFVAGNRWNQAAKHHTLAEVIDIILEEFFDAIMPSLPCAH